MGKATVADKTTDETQETHPFGWADHEGECVRCNCTLEDNEGLPISHCKKCYFGLKERGMSLVPGSKERARATDRFPWGKYSEEEYGQLFDADGEPKWCGQEGCSNRATHTDPYGYPQCDRCRDAYRARGKARREQAKEAEKNGSRAATRAATKQKPISDEEWGELSTLSATDLSILFTKGKRDRQLALSEWATRISDHLAGIGSKAEFLAELDQILPPRAQIAETSQPTPTRVDTKAGRKQAPAAAAKARAEAASTG